MDISRILSFKFPGAQWSMLGDEYSNLIWHDSVIIKPTLSELQTASEEMESSNLLESFVSAMELLILTTAKTKGYKSTLSVVSYALSINLDWKAEALAFVMWRDNCWQYAINVKAEIKSGTIHIPTVDEFIEAAPKIVWPTGGL